MKARSILVAALTSVFVSGLASAECPPDFLDVNSGAGSIGCILNVSPSPATADWDGAVASCLDTYGARLPTSGEYAAANTLAAFDAPTASAFTGSWVSGSSAMSLSTDGSFNLVGVATTRQYRCFAAHVPVVPTHWIPLALFVVLLGFGWRALQFMRPMNST